MNTAIPRYQVNRLLNNPDKLPDQRLIKKTLRNGWIYNQPPFLRSHRNSLTVFPIRLFKNDKLIAKFKLKMPGRKIR